MNALSYELALLLFPAVSPSDLLQVPGNNTATLGPLLKIMSEILAFLYMYCHFQDCINYVNAMAKDYFSKKIRVMYNLLPFHHPFSVLVLKWLDKLI